MKIAMPLLNEKELAVDFTHSNFIGIYDVKENEIKFISNNTLESKLKAMDILKDMVAEGLMYAISPFYSYMSLRIFKENNIKTLKSRGIKIDDNILSFKESSLFPFHFEESLLTGECARDCLGCGPTESCSTK
jgi:predicted Fe-Mo cluster-binding NifX family protein